MLEVLALSLLGCGSTDCAEGFGRDASGACVPLDLSGAAPDDSAPDSATDSAPDSAPDSATDSDAPSDPGRWFDPMSGTPNVLFMVLDTQRADALRAQADALPSWFTDSGVDYPLFYTPSSHTGESATWMMSGCDVRDGPSQSTGDDGAPDATLPEGCETVADVYNAVGYQTLLTSENYGFVNGSWYKADSVSQTAVPRLEWADTFMEQMRALPEPWAATWWTMGSRLPFLKLSDEEGCETAPLGYDLSLASSFDAIEATIEEIASEDLATLREALACNYAADTREVLERTAELLEVLKEEGFLEDTVVVLTSDHGELLLDYTDPAYPEGYAEPHHWLEHGNQLFGHETAGFAKVWYPGADGLRSVERVSGSPDLLALLYYLTGADQGQTRGALPWEPAAPTLQALKDGEYLFGVAYEDGGVSYRYQVKHWDGSLEQLYDLDTDPDETTNLIDQGQAPPQEILELLDAIEGR